MYILKIENLKNQLWFKSTYKNKFRPLFLIALCGYLSTYLNPLLAEEPIKTLEQTERVSATSPLTSNNEKQYDSWRFLHPYEASYAVISDKKRLGTSIRKLTFEQDLWQLSTQASLSKYFIKLKSHEYSVFDINGQSLQTREFNSNTKITFKKAKKMKQVFDLKTGTEVGSRGKNTWKLKHNKPVFDRVSHLVQLREDLLKGKPSLVYNVSYKGKLNEFQYQIDSVETIDTKMGQHETVKLVRSKSNGDVFTLWLSPELNYFPVQIAQYEQDKPDVTMLLESLSYQQPNKLPKD